jgi:hypothetical protein
LPALRNIKKFPMKKLLGVLAIAVAMAACNNSGVEGSSASSADSATKMAADSVKTPVDSSARKMDSTATATDTTKKM